MALAIQIEKHSNSSKVIPLHLKVVNDRALNDMGANHLSTASFFKGF